MEKTLDDYFKKSKELKEITVGLKDLRKEIKDLKEKITEYMTENGLTEVSTNLGEISIIEKNKNVNLNKDSISSILESKTDNSNRKVLSEVRELILKKEIVYVIKPKLNE